jgi:hypothetical protein
MSVQKLYQLKRDAYSAGSISLSFTVTHEGHPKIGQTFEFRVFDSFGAKPDAKSSALPGAAGWPVTYTQTRAENPTHEMKGVPFEECMRYMKFIGDKNGPAATIGTIECVAKLPGLDENKVSVEGAKLENIGEVMFAREGSMIDLTGPVTMIKIDGIDPITQDY